MTMVRTMLGGTWKPSSTCETIFSLKSMILTFLDLWWRRWQPGALIVLVSLLQVVHRAVPPQIGLLASPNKVLGRSIENPVGISSRKAACAWSTQRIGVRLMSCPLLSVVVLWLLQLVSGHDRA